MNLGSTALLALAMSTDAFAAAVGKGARSSTRAGARRCARESSSAASRCLRMIFNGFGAPEVEEDTLLIGVGSAIFYEHLDAV